MTLMGKLLVATAVTMLSASPALAAPTNPAASLSIAKTVRTSAPTSRSRNKLAGGGLIIVAAAAAAVIAGIILIIDDNDDSDSN